MLTLEALSPDDFPLVASWLSQPEINRWLSSEWRGRSIDTLTMAVVVRNKRNKIFSVRFLGKCCGIVGLSDIDLLDRTAMVWYVLGDTSLRGRGLTTESVIQITKVAFLEMGIFSLYAWIMEDNQPSRRVLEKAGFCEIGRIRRSACSNGRQVDRIYFDLVHNGTGEVF